MHTKEQGGVEIRLDENGNRIVVEGGQAKLLVPHGSSFALSLVSPRRVAASSLLMVPQPDLLAHDSIEAVEFAVGGDSSRIYSSDFDKGGWFSWKGKTPAGKPNKATWNFVQRRLTAFIAGFQNLTLHWDELPTFDIELFKEDGSRVNDWTGVGVRWVGPKDSSDIKDGGEEASYILDGSIHTGKTLELQQKYQVNVSVVGNGIISIDSVSKVEPRLLVVGKNHVQVEYPEFEASTCESKLLNAESTEGLHVNAGVHGGSLFLDVACPIGEVEEVELQFLPTGNADRRGFEFRNITYAGSKPRKMPLHGIPKNNIKSLLERDAAGFPYGQVNQLGVYSHTYDSRFPALTLSVWAAKSFNGAQLELLRQSCARLIRLIDRPDVRNCAFSSSSQERPASEEAWHVKLWTWLMPECWGCLGRYLAIFQDSLGGADGQAELSGQLGGPGGAYFLQIFLNRDHIGNPNYVVGNSVQWWSGVIGHEIIHNLGFKHPQGQAPPGGWSGYFVQEFGNCITRASDGLAPFGFIPGSARVPFAVENDGNPEVM